MADPFDEVVACVRQKYRELLAGTKYTVADLPKDMPLAGVYLFSENDQALYVGRTNKLRVRLRAHTNNSHNTATFAFLTARHETGNLRATYRPKGSRKDLLNDPTFRDAFDAAREHIKRMDVQFVEEADPVKQAILEIFSALQSQAKYNDFDNH